MSIHSSLRTSGTLARDRNVWTRLERLLALKKEKRWADGASIFGLPKVRTRFKVAGAKIGNSIIRRVVSLARHSHHHQAAIGRAADFLRLGLQ